MLAPLAVCLLALTPARASLDGSNSPTLTLLNRTAAQDTAAAGATRPEDSKEQASQAFTGGSPAASAPLPTGTAANGQSYIMVGQSPIQGISIYTPKLDPSGHGTTGQPTARDFISRKKVFGAGALGAAAVVGGLMAGGGLGAALLVLGGALLGVAALFGWLNHKLKKGKR